MSIKRKIVLGYVLLIFIPVLGFGFHYYSQIYGNLTQQFVESRQKILEQAYGNLSTDFVRIQSIHRLLQYNPYLTDYLDGVYQSDSDSIYTLIRYILPLFSQSVFANPEVDSIMIYKMKENVLPITDQFRDRTMLDPGIAERVSTLKAGEGLWLRKDPNVTDPELVYYQHIYNTQITEIIGLLEIKVQNELLHNFYAAAGVTENWSAMLVSRRGEILTQRHSELGSRTEEWVKDNQQPFFFDRNTIVNQIELKPLDVRVLVTGKVSDVFHTVKKKGRVLIITIALLLIALSFGYYALASTITRRILNLAKHMRTLKDHNLRQHSIQMGPFDNDEIGFLTVTYNNMIQRMDELINNVHRAELRNKEAAYKVLQAQIKPHFLYNTIETIRMVAEANHDQEVADITYWFGKLMRYSLSSEREETVLANEIEIVRFYLNIHKMRLDKRLTYDLDVQVNAERIRCPRFLLQPLIENSIIHGASAVLRPVHIQLNIREAHGDIIIEVSDNGNGIDPEKLSKLTARLRNVGVESVEQVTGGVGLMNVNERVKAYYGEGSRLEIDSETGKGTCLRVIINKGAVSEV